MVVLGTNVAIIARNEIIFAEANLWQEQLIVCIT